MWSLALLGETCPQDTRTSVRRWAAYARNSAEGAAGGGLLRSTLLRGLTHGRQSSV